MRSTYSHQKSAAEIRRDNKRRPTVKDERTMKMTLNATNDGARFSFRSIMSNPPCIILATTFKMFSLIILGTEGWSKFY